MLVRGDVSQEPARKDQAIMKLKGKLDWITVDAAKLWIPHWKGNQGSPGIKEQRGLVEGGFLN